jgi:hypothetical protein
MADGISYEELQLAARNHGMPLEALRYDVTPAGLHYLLIHYDIPEVHEDDWRLEVGGAVDRSATLDLAAIRARDCHLECHEPRRELIVVGSACRGLLAARELHDLRLLHLVRLGSGAHRRLGLGLRDPLLHGLGLRLGHRFRLWLRLGGELGRRLRLGRARSGDLGVRADLCEHGTDGDRRELLGDDRDHAGGGRLDLVRRAAHLDLDDGLVSGDGRAVGDHPAEDPAAVLARVEPLEPEGDHRAINTSVGRR